MTFKEAIQTAVVTIMFYGMLLVFMGGAVTFNEWVKDAHSDTARHGAGYTYSKE